MDATPEANMTDNGPRGLTTDRELEILLGETEDDISEKYYGVVVTRVRKRINRLVNKELEGLEAHDTLANELRDGVCAPREE